MTRIVIDGVDSRRALVRVLRAVRAAMDAEGAFDESQHVFSGRAAEAEEGGWLDVSPDGVRLIDMAKAPWNQPKPLAYAPCPDRGSHERLTDCWLCWGDVMRGVLLEPEAVRRDRWLEDADPAGPQD